MISVQKRKATTCGGGSAPKAPARCARRQRTRAAPAKGQTGANLAGATGKRDEAAGGRSAADESVWIFGLINNIEQLLSTFNAAQTSGSGTSTPSSLSSSSSSGCFSSASSPSSSCTSTLSSGGSLAGSSGSLPRSPLSRQIKFHEYKGPPSARRQAQPQAPTRPEPQPQPQSQTQTQPQPHPPASRSVGQVSGRSGGRQAGQPYPSSAQPAAPQVTHMQQSEATQKTRTLPTHLHETQRHAGCGQPGALTSPGQLSQEPQQYQCQQQQIAQPASRHLEQMSADCLQETFERQPAAPTSVQPPAPVQEHLRNQAQQQLFVRLLQTDAYQTLGYPAPEQLAYAPPALECQQHQQQQQQCMQLHDNQYLTHQPSHQYQYHNQQQQLQLQQPHQLQLQQQLTGNFGPDSEDTTDACEIEPTITFSHGVDELLFSEFIDLQDVPMNVDESDWLKKFLPPCSMG